MTRADVYGRYSLGSGAILADKDRVWSELDDGEVIASYERSMRRDLAKAGIPVEALANWHIMDVGTGRQALAFLKMGAPRVSHFDISPENVARVERHVGARDLGGRLTSTCCDLVATELGRSRFDFVYLNGIVQHFSDVGRGLANCIRALRPDGLLWLYFYRSGTFDNFVLYMLRTLVGGSNVATDGAAMSDHYTAARMFFAADAKDNYLSSIYMDGVFTRYARLYTVETYLNFASACGLEVISSSGIDPLGRSVDHHFARAAGVMTLRKRAVVDDVELADATRLLAPENEVDQLDMSLYEAPEIRRSVALYHRLKAALDAPGVPRWMRIFAAMRLFALLAQTRAPDYDAMCRHDHLHEMLERLIALLASEYGARASRAQEE